MDLLLVNPSINTEVDKAYILSRRINAGVPNQESPPLGMAYLLARAKQLGLKAQFVDMAVTGMSIEDLMTIIRELKPSVVGLSAFTVKIKAAGQVAEGIKERFPYIRVCCGGPHVTAMPIDALREFKAFDYVVCGEGENALTGMLNGEVGDGIFRRDSTSYDKGVVVNLDHLSLPAWEDMDLSDYAGHGPYKAKRELPISTSRGCPFKCVFCARNSGSIRRHRTIKSIITEIERDIAEFGCDALTFNDETFVVDVAWSKQLFQTMIRHSINEKVRWGCETRVDTATPDLFEAMRDAGCYYVGFGFESGDDRILKLCGKNFTVEQMKQAVRWAREAGLVCVGSFILGLPGETETTARKSIDLAKELNVWSVTFPIAVPLPGTELRRMAMRGDFGLRILSNDWDDYGKQAGRVMESDTMSAERLRELQVEAYAENPKKPAPA